MASPLLLSLVAWQAVGSSPTVGNRAYLDLPLDRDYETIVIKATADTKTDAKQVITNIRVVVNGVAVRELTVADVRRLNAKYGATYNSADLTQVTLNFKEDWLWNHVGADQLSLFTAGLISVRLEVDLAVALTNPALGGYAITKVQRQVAPGTNRIRKTKLDTLDFAGAGTKIFRNISPAGLVKAFDLASTNNAVTQVKFRISGTEVFNLTKPEVDDAMAQNEQTAAANYFTLPFDMDGTFDAGLMASMIRETELEVTVSAAANVRLIHQYYEAVA